ncbi:MAG: glycosyltransferase [Bacillota bacterium]|jgi:glycosyltransferase involved in cell wall biosynthesis
MGIKKVLFVLPSLAGGGAERVIVTLLKNLDRSNFQPHLALIRKEGPYLLDLPDDVPVYDLGCRKIRWVFLPLLLLIWRLRPATVFSTIGHLNIALIILKPLIPRGIFLVIREAMTLSEDIKQYSHHNFWLRVYRFFYKKADLIICQSYHTLHDLATNFGVPVKKMKVIYNPVDIKAMITKADERNPFANTAGSPNLLAVGRLCYQKGFDRLIESMPDLLKIKPGAKLWILGTGPDEEKLKQLAVRLGLEKNICFAGFQKNPYPWFGYADLFILSSYYEGLPNVLLEAIACGCPVLVVDHPGGTREIMELTGQLHRLIPSLYWKDDWFMRNKNELEDRVERNFSVSLIVKQYNQYLTKD